jgi:small-conductance mechanosensitive channel
LDEEKTTSFIIFLMKIVRYLIIFLSLYLSISLAFSVFPATRGIANILFGYVLMPVKSMFYSVVKFIPNLITIVVIVLIFRYLIRGLRYLAEEIDKGRLTLKGFYPDWAHPTFSIVKTLLYAFMFVVIFPYLPGSDSDVFKGVSIFIGVVFSLGSSSVINNVMSGLVLTYMRPFKVGDRIKIGEIVGNVIEKTPFVTRIRTPKNEEVTIPNSSIMSAQTFNYSESARTCGLILHTELTLGYDIPWRQIHELLLNAAKRTPDVLKNPKPYILQTALDDFYVEYQLNVYTNDADKMPRIYSALHQNIQDVFNESGVEIMSPHYQAHRDGNQTTIPASYLSKDYQAPPFHVKIENKD